MNFLNADISDPTDFPPYAIAPGLRNLDGSFRCDICGELYDAPVTIACGHCFCSGCIRIALSNKQECPNCRKTASEVHIRPNLLLDKVISDWKTARPFVLQLVKKNEEYTGAPEDDHATSRKRKRSPSRASSADTSGPSRVPSSPNTPSVQKKIKFIDMTIPSSDAEEEEISIPSDTHLAPKADTLVACPLCQCRIKYLKLNDHMDNGCKEPSSSTSAAKTWSKIMGGDKKKGKHKRKGSESDDEYPLPIQTYATLKDKQLKEMLHKYDLPVNGDRSNWEQRHQRWVILNNSNLDRSSVNRKTKAELRKDLKKWEDDMAKKKKVDIHDLVEYQIQQKDEFAKLITVARPNQRTQAPLQPQTPVREAETTISPSLDFNAAPTTNSGSYRFIPRSRFTFVAKGNDDIVVDSEEEQ